MARTAVDRHRRSEHRRAGPSPTSRPTAPVIAADSGLDHALASRPGGRSASSATSTPSRPAAWPRAESAGVAIERHPPAKDATDTELAIVAAGRLGRRHLIGVCGGPRPDETRLDHELGGILAFARPGLAADRDRAVVGPGPPVRAARARSRRSSRAPAAASSPFCPCTARHQGSSRPVCATRCGRDPRSRHQPGGQQRGRRRTPAAVRLDLGVLLVVRPLALEVHHAPRLIAARARPPWWPPRPAAAPPGRAGPGGSAEPRAGRADPR